MRFGPKYDMHIGKTTKLGEVGLYSLNYVKKCPHPHSAGITYVYLKLRGKKICEYGVYLHSCTSLQVFPFG